MVAGRRGRTGAPRARRLPAGLAARGHRLLVAARPGAGRELGDGRHRLALVRPGPARHRAADRRRCWPTSPRWSPRGSSRARPARPSPPAGDAGTRVTITSEDLGTVLLRFSGGATGVVTVGQVCAGHKNDCWLEVCGRQALAALGAGAAERAVDRRPTTRQRRAGQGPVAGRRPTAQRYMRLPGGPPGGVGRRLLQRDARHLRRHRRAGRGARRAPPAMATFDDGVRLGVPRRRGAAQPSRRRGLDRRRR